MNKEVSYPIAKLLKEKGFNEPTFGFYSYRTNKYATYSQLIRVNLLSDNYAAPTIADVVMWLYEKYGIWIHVCISRYGKFYCNIFKKELTKCLDIPISWETQIQLNDFNSQTEAYEAAFEYTLNHII